MFRYIPDQRFSLEKKSAFEVSVNGKMSVMKLLKEVNNAATLKTAVKAAEKQKDKENLMYQPTRLREVLVEVIKSPERIKMMRELNTRTIKEIEESFEELNVRLFLMGMILVSGGGVRPHAISNMTVGEFLSASQEDEDTMVVLVSNHKMMRKHWPQSAPFTVDGLYQATSKYLNTYRYGF